MLIVPTSEVITPSESPTYIIIEKTVFLES